MARSGALRSDTTLEEALGAGAPGGLATLNAQGKVPSAQLGGPGADATTFLRGDQVWAVPVPAAPVPREDLVASWELSSVKTNIGTAFVDVYTQTNADGKSVQIDTTGKTQARLMVLWNKIGTGTHTVRVVEGGTGSVLLSLDVVSGRNMSGLVAIPAALQNRTLVVKLQAKSTTAADDPVCEGARLYLK